MLIAGGVYRELCARPRWRQIFGSGGRAAHAVATLSPNSELLSYANRDWVNGVGSSAASVGLQTTLRPIEEKITFEYLHPLSVPRRYPPHIVQQEPLKASADTVLRFGFVEGEAIVAAERAIYDPQTGGTPEPFDANGSKAEELAVVLNAREAVSVSNTVISKAGPAILSAWNASVVIIKLGCEGAMIYERGKRAQRVNPYSASRIFKIGSGDIFSAVFAHCWGELRLPTYEAANRASAAVAQYVETRALPFHSLPNPNKDRRLSKFNPPYVYLAGPFFDLSQRWLIEECVEHLESFGADVFSPIHQVGYAEDVANVAFEDLEGLKEAEVVLLLADALDPGSIFEAGFAKALEDPKPVVVFAERLGEYALTMFRGTDCLVTDDFATAIYKTIWATAR